MSASRVSSSWISSIAYRRTPDDATYIAVFIHPDHWPTCDGKGIPVAMLYGGPESPVPSHLPGLLCAGTAKRSPGLAYNRLLKGRYSYQRIEGEERVRELKRLMETP